MSAEQENYESLKKKALHLGFDIFGVADITEIRKDFLLEQGTAERYIRAAVMGKRLLDAVLEEIKDSPTALYFHHYRQTNFFLDRTAFHLSSAVQQDGYRALPIAASQVLDWNKQTAHLSHKHVGRLAGLGWIGRSNLLINPELGARFRLVTILTDMPLEADRSLERDCGKCRACLAPCPASAIKEEAADFDHMACYEKLREFRRRHLVGQNICGVCVRACQGPKP